MNMSAVTPAVKFSPGTAYMSARRLKRSVKVAHVVVLANGSFVGRYGVHGTE